MVELRVHLDTLGFAIQLMFAPHRGLQAVITDCEQIISSVTSLWSPGADSFSDARCAAGRGSDNDEMMIS